MQETSIFRAFIEGFHRMVFSTNKSVKVTRTGESGRLGKVCRTMKRSNVMRKEHAWGRYEARIDWKPIRKIDGIKQDG